MSENAVYAEWTVLWRVLIQLWDKWPKCLIEKKQTDLEHTTTLQKKHYQGKYAKEMTAHALLKPLPHLNKSHKTWAEHVVWFKANWKHARKLLCFFGAARTCILGSALYIIQVTWFTNVFSNIFRMPKWVQFAGCNLDIAIHYCHLTFGECLIGFHTELGWKYAKYVFMTRHGYCDFSWLHNVCHRLRMGAIFAWKFVSFLPETQKKYGFYDFEWNWTLQMNRLEPRP